VFVRVATGVGAIASCVGFGAGVFATKPLLTTLAITN